MDVLTRRAFERPDVEADGVGFNPRQYSSGLVHGAKWSEVDHDAIASSSGGSVIKLSVTGRCQGAVIDQHGTLRDPPLVNFAHFQKVNASERAAAYSSSG